MILTAGGVTKTPLAAALQFFAAELPAPLLRLAPNGRSAGVVVTSEMVSGESRELNSRAHKAGTQELLSQDEAAPAVYFLFSTFKVRRRRLLPQSRRKERVLNSGAHLYNEQRATVRRDKALVFSGEIPARQSNRSSR